MQPVARHRVTRISAAPACAISLARSVFGQSSNSPSSPDATITAALMVKPVM